jgi:hypothetical protein
MPEHIVPPRKRFRAPTLGTIHQWPGPSQGVNSLHMSLEVGSQSKGRSLTAGYIAFKATFMFTKQVFPGV